MGKFVIHLITALLWTGVLAGGLVASVYFGGPMVWAHILAGEQARVTAHAQAGALDADRLAMNRQQKSCAEEIAAAGRAQAAIAKASQPQTVAAGQPRPMVTAAEIREMLQ